MIDKQIPNYLKGIVMLLMISLGSCSSTPKTEKTTVSGRQILVNESPYLIKGICYHPVPKGSTKRDFGNLTQDIALMQDAGINTVRVYEPIDDIDILDQFKSAGIKVIIGFGYNQKGVYDISSGTYIDYVDKYKNHDAILFWELGNEYNYHPEWFDGDIKNWYSEMDDAAKHIHNNDPSHLVSTAHGELPDSVALSLSKNIDIWGMNVYRFDDPSAIFSIWSTISPKPMYLSEAGGDSYMTITKDGYEKGINQKAQADANNSILNSVFDNTDICSGVTLFSFTDGWWKAGNPQTQDPGGWAPNSTGVPYDGTPNEEFWGIVDINRNKKETFSRIKKIYRGLTNPKP